MPWGKTKAQPSFIERTGTDDVPEVVWKVFKKKKKKDFPPPNEAVLWNIYGAERKQGRTLTFTDTVISCCRHMIQARAGAKESQPLCLEEVLISRWPGDLFQRATGWISACVQKLEHRSVSKTLNYTRFLCNTIFFPIETPFIPSLHLQCWINLIVWSVCDRGGTSPKLKPTVNTGLSPRDECCLSHSRRHHQGDTLERKGCLYETWSF